MSLLFSKRRSKVRITLVIRHVSRRPQPELPIAEPPVPESTQIQNPPVPEPVQIHFPELDTLESTLTDAASLDQLMWLNGVSVQNLLDHCHYCTTIVFGNQGQCPDRLTYYEPEYPYTILFEPNFVVLVPRSFGKTVIVFTSHLDLTWENGVDLKFFRVCRSLSHPVSEAYQPKNTNAYPHFGSHVLHATGGRVRDVVGRWEMHRDENLPWGRVCL
ncbi:uncharacterized protein TNCV_409731 [Trichonephila clavipes]|nr:uncharacterized protein TNCV_409731 [Trichonephila clavipes]